MKKNSHLTFEYNGKDQSKSFHIDTIIDQRLESIVKYFAHVSRGSSIYKRGRNHFLRKETLLPKLKELSWLIKKNILYSWPNYLKKLLKFSQQVKGREWKEIISSLQIYSHLQKDVKVYILRNYRTYLKRERLFLVFINQKGKRRAIYQNLKFFIARSKIKIFPKIEKRKFWFKILELSMYLTNFFSRYRYWNYEDYKFCYQNCETYK